jgi:hypothetical protein
MHLFSDNKSLFKFNAEKLSKLKNDLHVLPAKFRVPVKLKDKLLPEAVMNSLYSTSYFFKNKDKMETRTPSMLHLKIGARVQLTTNINEYMNLTNGSLGIITVIYYVVPSLQIKPTNLKEVPDLPIVFVKFDKFNKPGVKHGNVDIGIPILSVTKKYKALRSTFYQEQVPLCWHME